jgi:hypothetical protein
MGPAVALLEVSDRLNANGLTLIDETGLARGFPETNSP